jgi:hypothetical protein
MKNDSKPQSNKIEAPQGIRSREFSANTEVDNSYLGKCTKKEEDPPKDNSYHRYNSYLCIQGMRFLPIKISF